MIGASSAIGTNYGNSFSLNGTDSQRAVDLLKRDFPAQSGDSDQIVLHARSGSVTAPPMSKLTSANCSAPEKMISDDTRVRGTPSASEVLTFTQGK